MSNVEELLQKRQEIEDQIKEAKREERQDDLKTVRQLCRKHGFTYNMVKNYLVKGRQRTTIS